jgi:hypothetical protein
VYEQMIFPIVALSVRCVFGHDGDVLTWFDASVAVGSPIPFWVKIRTSRDSCKGSRDSQEREGMECPSSYLFRGSQGPEGYGISRSRAAQSPAEGESLSARWLSKYIVAWSQSR